MLAAGKPAFLFLDYDGTLAPIRNSPEKAIMSVRTTEVLGRLAANPRISVWIITGRSLADIRRMVAIGGVKFIGNHGLEIDAGGKRWEHPSAREIVEMMKGISYSVADELSGIRGVMVENKGLTLSVHYRNAKGITEEDLVPVIEQSLTGHGRILRVVSGKKVLEIRPETGWDKGAVANIVLAFYSTKTKQAILYAGDDMTDEDAFSTLPDDSFTIKVGSDPDTAARFRVNGVREIRALLEMIDREGKPAHPERKN
jgi:trehalose 6-phosphate phosphatase